MSFFGRCFFVFAVAAGGVAPAWAQDGPQNLDAGKSAAQIFTSDCQLCHKSPQGLASKAGILGVESFLREHYTSSRESAAALAGYLKAAGDAPAAANARAKGKPSAKGEAKRPDATKLDEKKPGEEKKPAEAKPDAAKTETKPESKPETKPAETKPAEAKPVEAKPVEVKPADAKPADAKSD